MPPVGGQPRIGTFAAANITSPFISNQELHGSYKVQQQLKQIPSGTSSPGTSRSNSSGGLLLTTKKMTMNSSSSNNTHSIISSHLPALTASNTLPAQTIAPSSRTVWHYLHENNSINNPSYMGISSTDAAG